MSTNGENQIIVEVPAHEPEDPRVVARRRIIIWIVVIAAFALAVGPFVIPKSYDSKKLPEFLIGEWTSSHPQYSDRYITLTPGSITFGVGGTSSVKYTVFGIEQEHVDGVNTIVLHFRDVAGTAYSRSLVIDASGDEIFFASQPAVVWKRYGQ